jgi:ABC transporter, permease protein
MQKLNRKTYPIWLASPGLIIYIIIFIIPTFASFYFSMTIWNLKEARFVGLENFITFFSMTNTRTALINTSIFAFVTCCVKIILGLLLAQYICSGIKSGNYLKIVIFFPYLLGNVVVALAFRAILEPAGTVNQFLQLIGLDAVRWLTDKRFALMTCIVADIWKGIGTVTIILIAGICAIPKSYYEAAAIDGASPWRAFRKITLPLLIPSFNTVLTLCLIGGLRSYDLVQALTGGGPGYSSEVLGTVIYKLFARGNYGLATAGNVILFIIVAFIVFPINSYVAKREVDMS